VIVNETPKFQCLESTNISHTVSVRGDKVDDVLVIPLDLHSVVSCFETFKSTHEEFDTCDRYGLVYKRPEYDPYTNSFSKQEAGMPDSWGNLKLPGGLSSQAAPILHYPSGGAGNLKSECVLQ
jgi:hypothetical protein